MPVITASSEHATTTVTEPVTETTAGEEAAFTTTTLTPTPTASTDVAATATVEFEEMETMIDEIPIVNSTASNDTESGGDKRHNGKNEDTNSLIQINAVSSQ